MPLFRRSERIHGLVIPAPRFTRHALVYFLKYLTVPVLLVLLLLDLALYVLFREAFDACYGVMCFWE